MLITLSLSFVRSLVYSECINLEGPRVYVRVLNGFISVVETKVPLAFVFRLLLCKRRERRLC